MKVLATTSLNGIESFLKRNSGKTVQVTVRNPLPFVEEYDTFIHLDSKGVEEVKKLAEFDYITNIEVKKC